jgi:hypothetical protein
MSVSVSENIRIIEENIKKFNDQMILIQQELIRLDGSLKVFKSLSDLGIDQIGIPQDEVTNREVIDKLD